MSLIKTTGGYWVNPYWCGADWFIRITDLDSTIGVLLARRDITDKTIATRLRRVLRKLGVKGKLTGSVYRESGVFKQEGGDYLYHNAGISSLVMTEADIDINFLDSGNLISGLMVEEHNVRKKNT